MVVVVVNDEIDTDTRVSLSTSPIHFSIKMFYSLNIAHSDWSQIPARSAVQSNTTS